MVTGNNKVWRKFTFAAITTSKIRVYGRAASDNGYSRITEVEAWRPTESSAGSAVQWLVTDHLGTPRMVLDQTGGLASAKRHDYLPFGEELHAQQGLRTVGLGYDANDGVRKQFTSKERDIETGLDYFGFRYFASIQGHWTSIDPMIDFERNVGEPQAWNLYQYCINNPLSRTDPDGRQDSIRLNGAHAYELQLRKDGFSDEQIKVMMVEYRKAEERALKMAVVMLAGIAAAEMAPALIEPFLLFAARNPDRVEQAGQMSLELAGGPPSLVPSPNSRLRPTEVDSLTRLSKQLGSTLIESPHRGEEVIGVVAGTTKTIDVVGHSSFYANPKFKMTQFFDSIERHVRKSADYTAIDLKGATKEQIVTITGYVNKLEKKFRDKIIYISP